MNIKKISIYNFRSISEVSIPIKKINGKYCSIFLGLNESGKSNIFKAIGLLDPATTFDYDIDCNKGAFKSESNIDIEFELGFDDIKLYKKKFEEWGIPKKLISYISIYKVERKISIDSENGRKDFIHLWIRDKAIFKKYLFNSTESKLIETSDVYKGEEKLTKNNVQELVGVNFEVVSKLVIETLLESKMFSMIDANIPKPIIWRPSPEYLINDAVDLNQFATNPSISVPLRNIFSIAGIENIEKRLNLISSDNKEERRQLEEELTKSITDYINSIWSEHEINLLIDIENMLCTVMIEDKDDSRPKYKMEQRSDGFKQFISILLSLSIENKTSQIKNRLILLDEPEIHLHPSGVRYLRDELLRIAANNIVFIASHSIYMVDKLSLNRHFKVEKELSLTTIKQIDKDNPYQEEVIYEALGTSVYEHVKPNMIVFEGKTDKDVFDAFTQKYKVDLKPKNIGTISADGVEKIPLYTKFFDGKFVKGFVVVDSDTDGVRIKERVKNQSPSFSSKNTFEINDLVGGSEKLTLEDLYPHEVVIEVIRNSYRIEIQFTDGPIVKQLDKRNKDNEQKLNIKELKGVLTQYVIKDISNLTKDACKKKYFKYFKFLTKIHSNIK